MELESKKKKCAQASHHTKKRSTQRNVKRAVADKDYDSQKKRKAQHMRMLRKLQMKRIEIEKETTKQAASNNWRYYRTQIITASHFGHICKMKKSTSCASRVKSIIYPQKLNVESVQYGTKYENVAHKSIEQKLNINIRRCGLFIDSKISFLGASPDGLIGRDGIVEIKCPFAARRLTPKNAIAKNVSKLQSLYKTGKDEKMNRSHIYYYQIQGQLHITQRQYCIFTLWTQKGLKTEKIKRDDVFWKKI